MYPPIASIIIPAHNRAENLDLAIKSAISQPNSELVEIIVVDDASDPPISSSMLRSFDLCIRNDSRMGAAVSRNRGIEAAKGMVVYLLDSDDHFIKRNYLNDATHFKPDTLYFCSIESKNFKSNYPQIVAKEDYIDYIAGKHPYITQTSSLAFLKSSKKIRFDEALPKHQDWDLVLCSALLNDIPVQQYDGASYFDRSDKRSLSRTHCPKLSDPWISKLKSLNALPEADIQLLEYIAYGSSRSRMTWVEFWKRSVNLIINNDRVRAPLYLKTLLKRIIKNEDN